jgi:hypothetical protein
MKFVRAVSHLSVILALSLLGTAAEQRDSGLSSLPAAAQSAVSAALGREDALYHPTKVVGGLEATNPAQQLSTYFGVNGVDFRCSSSHFRLALRSYGYGNALRAVDSATPHADGNRVEYRRGPLTEWYVNGPVGLEQGFTIARSLGKANGQPLTIALALSGDLTATLDKSATALTLGGAENHAAIQYAGLTATDAAGKQLRARMALQGKQLLLRVDDNGARYPVVIDPWIRLAELTYADGKSDTYSGYSVAVSGNTIVVGAPSFTRHDLKGAAYVFVEPSSGWANMTQTAKLVTTDGTPKNSLDFAVSVAIDGNTVVVGAQSGSAAYVYVEPSSGWPAKMNETAKLVASDGMNGLGISVSISGGTVLAGAGGIGAYVFVEPSSGWPRLMTQTAKLTASDGQVDDEFGRSVSIDGDTAVAGGQLENSQAGAAYVFVKPVGRWRDMTQTAKLTASDGVAGDQLGLSVSISGSTVVAGAPQGAIGSKYLGAAYVFLRPAHGWTDMTQTAKLTDSASYAGEFLGWAVSVNGGTVVASSPGESRILPRGVVCVFTRPKSGWTDMTQTAKLRASDGLPGDAFGSSLSMSGTTVVVGAPYATVGSNRNQGKAYVFGH